MRIRASKSSGVASSADEGLIQTNPVEYAFFIYIFFHSYKKSLQLSQTLGVTISKYIKHVDVSFNIEVFFGGGFMGFFKTERKERKEKERKEKKTVG